MVLSLTRLSIKHVIQSMLLHKSLLQCNMQVWLSKTAFIWSFWLLVCILKMTLFRQFLINEDPITAAHCSQSWFHCLLCSSSCSFNALKSDGIWSIWVDQLCVVFDDVLNTYFCECSIVLCLIFEGVFPLMLMLITRNLFCSSAHE